MIPSFAVQNTDIALTTNKLCPHEVERQFATATTCATFFPHCEQRIRVANRVTFRPLGCDAIEHSVTLCVTAERAKSL